MYPTLLPFVHKRPPFVLHNGLIAKTNLRKRIAASFLDFSFMVIFFLLSLLVLQKSKDVGTLNLSPNLLIPLVVYWFLYFVGLESIFGATPGHKLLKLEVVSLENRKIHWIQALKRHLLDIVDYYLFCVPSLIAIYNSEKHQRIGDMWAGTLVIDQSEETQDLKN